MNAALPLVHMLAAIASPGGARGRLSILIYHRVTETADPLLGLVTATEFDLQLEALRRCFSVIPLPEAIARLDAGTLPPRAAAITFDDGYADNANVALPILRKHGLHATFFIASAFLDGGRMWNDTVIESVRRTERREFCMPNLIERPLQLEGDAARRSAIEMLIGLIKHRSFAERSEYVRAIAKELSAALPDDLMMTSAQVRALHGAGMEIGGHTARHPILAALPEAEARREIVEGREALESIVGGRVRLFAYPNGKPGRDYSRAHVEMARELEFDAAVSTARGVATSRSDRYQLPRFTPWDRSPQKFAMRLAYNALRTTPASPFNRDADG